MPLWEFPGESSTPTILRELFGKMTSAEWWKAFGGSEAEDAQPAELTEAELRCLKRHGIKPGLGMRMT